MAVLCMGSHHFSLSTLLSLTAAKLPSTLANAATAMITGGMPMIVHSFMRASRRRRETCVLLWDGDVVRFVRCL
jgi:hypothetical protein